MGDTDGNREMSQDGKDITGSTATLTTLGGWGIRGWLSALHATIVAMASNILLGATVIPDNFKGGCVFVGTTAVEVTFTATPIKKIIISSESVNTGILYIGPSDVTYLGGNAIAELVAGDRIEFDYDDSSNALYVVASIAAQHFFKGAFFN